MTSATVHRRAHLETVIEFEMDPDPVPTPPHDLGERALHVRRLLAITGTAIGLAVAGAFGAGIAASSAPPAPATENEAAPLEPVHASCSAVGTTFPRPGEPHMRCTVTVPVGPSAEVAERAAEAAIARARAQTHGPGAGTTRRWDPTHVGMGSP